ncbi:alcohol dehydrogenase catalytic domain-containing protein [Nevskia soli]|jgi:L-iditol 2-dehydrogenase|uniref:alcohol dehydrogenase catalytic domain-containing protein n=1 Tax=Nevskia soli TaxID=418856 RepID=UPI0015D8F0CD|nr:alcohol dehydrogenase catalytic domain-containing protein [Nevskia soli]
MLAAVYRGDSVVAVERIAVPEIGPGELLLRVEACGVCHTDLKKVEYNLLPPPRVFGHETAGTVVAVGAGVQRFRVGDRVISFHHIPCSHCFYCERGLYAQCKVYKRVGVTAGFEPAGGGFAQYVRVMDWIVERGVERIPDGVSFEVASFVEPVNTCLKAVEQLAPAAGDVIVVMGQGPIGLIFTMLLAQRGVKVIATDTMLRRLELSKLCGAEIALDPLVSDVAKAAAVLTDGRGADAVILATAVPGLVEQAVDCSRPGAKILLFAQTSSKERIELSGASICVGERILFGSYSASVDVQKQSAELVFSGKLPLDRLISHRMPLARIHDAFQLATKPTAESLKIVVNPHG